MLRKIVRRVVNEVVERLTSDRLAQVTAERDGLSYIADAMANAIIDVSKVRREDYPLAVREEVAKLRKRVDLAEAATAEASAKLAEVENELEPLRALRRGDMRDFDWAMEQVEKGFAVTHPMLGMKYEFGKRVPCEIRTFGVEPERLLVVEEEGSRSMYTGTTKVPPRLSERARRSYGWEIVRSKASASSSDGGSAPA